MPRYIINSGERFVLPDGTTLSGGDEIELGEDAAALHANRLQPVAAPAEVPPQAAPPVPRDL